jgi:hypothetical protein
LRAWCRSRLLHLKKSKPFRPPVLIPPAQVALFSIAI